MELTGLADLEVEWIISLASQTVSMPTNVVLPHIQNIFLKVIVRGLIMAIWPGLTLVLTLSFLPRLF